MTPVKVCDTRKDHEMTGIHGSSAVLATPATLIAKTFAVKSRRLRRHHLSPNHFLDYSEMEREMHRL
jgi:hypothetical protein